MSAFHTIAVPHEDILEGRLTMDTFAADLWEAYQNRGEVEYRDATLFFQKTYLTEGLKNLLGVVEKRLQGRGGDPVIQIQTPFGGGKTHALIALMHKAKEWGASRVVIVGTNLKANDTLWGELEKQIRGSNEVEIMKGMTAPGKSNLKGLLEKNQPVLILMDELLEYMGKAGGVKVGEGSLAGQTLAFMQELTECVASLDRSCLVVTLPTSATEHYDEGAEKYYVKLQKVCGRVEKIYTPVNEDEIAKVIRRRLFSKVDEKRVAEVVGKFVQDAQEENILPAGIEPTQYRDRFIDSYPFMPEVIDVLYHRWGSYPNFQRTRGVLRILSLVVYRHKNSQLPYISLADFDLANQEIRQELIKNIGTEFNSVIDQDIAGLNSGSKKVDNEMGKSYQGLNLGTRVATTIFMYSFSGGSEKGATLSEIKRCATTLDNPSSAVSDAVERIKSKLYYVQFQNDKYFFTNTPNLNKILMDKMENVSEQDILNTERDVIASQIGKDKFNVFIWEEDPGSIPDTKELKLIILREEKSDVVNQIIKSKGTALRVYCNTVHFLCPVAHEHASLTESIKRYLATQAILNDRGLELTKDQKVELDKNLRKHKKDVVDFVMRAYQCVLYPTREGYKKESMGIPIVGENMKLDQRVYEYLKSNERILEKMDWKVLKHKYLSQKDYISTANLLESSYKTPGEKVIASKEVLINAIREGVRNGGFGLGVMEGDKARCVYFKNEPIVDFTENEVIIRSELCEQQLEVEEKEKSVSYSGYDKRLSKGAVNNGSSATQLEIPEVGVKRIRKRLGFDVPRGKVSEVMRMLTNIQANLDRITIEIEGEFVENQYKNIITETLYQLGISDYKEEDI